MVLGLAVALPAPVKIGELDVHVFGEIVWGDPASDRNRRANLSQVLGTAVAPGQMLLEPPPVHSAQSPF
ncbi:MAG TPA: hypothetical protein VNW50_10110 [Streptosporangiaceae bacterium]|nr:hypothetical protein [Streptosporangiaceae bacterium]